MSAAAGPKIADRVYDVEDVAAMYRISAQTVRNLVKRGELPQPLRVGRLFRWRKEVIDAALEGKAQTA